jgi:hypothetical protein
MVGPVRRQADEAGAPKATFKKLPSSPEAIPGVCTNPKFVSNTFLYPD